MLVPQNCTIRNYLNSMIYKLSTRKNMNLIFTNTLSVNVTLQQAVKNRDNWTFLIAFDFPKKTFKTLLFLEPCASEV